MLTPKTRMSPFYLNYGFHPCFDADVFSVDAYKAYLEACDHVLLAQQTHAPSFPREEQPLLPEPPPPYSREPIVSQPRSNATESRTPEFSQPGVHREPLRRGTASPYPQREPGTPWTQLDNREQRRLRYHPSRSPTARKLPGSQARGAGHHPRIHPTSPGPRPPGLRAARSQGALPDLRPLPAPIPRGTSTGPRMHHQ